MKKLLFPILALLPALSFAQNAKDFSIKGKVANADANTKIYLVYNVGSNNVTDSSTVTNGDFAFKGAVADPVTATLFLDRKNLGFAKYVDVNFPDGRPSTTADGLAFFLEQGNMNIAIKDSAAKADITGSQLNDDNKTLKGQLQALTEKAKAISAEAQKATAEQQHSSAFQNSMQGKYKSLQAEQKSILKNFVSSHPDSYISLLALSSFGGPSPDVNELEPLFNSLSDNLKKSDGGRAMKAGLDGLKITAIGSLAPDFTQNDVNGKPVSLSSFRGKYVLVDFWASWCGPCRQENPNVVKLFNKYKGKNFTILGVSLDKNTGKDAWLAAIKNDGLTWTQVSDLQFWNNLAAKLYNVQSIPANFLIDPQGKIVAKNLRGDDLDTALEKYLGKI
ncbi:AhpC/TSA family protein [Mucilaginibacter conchicola]|uniref:AhpC/TSA family protein n=1 Tax=Mucilaginibacter conchicola TaxID=2303333 RepID=A0A372NS59_9SPHI|nr:TlpA disulfide reductase family protein [Mucilaginibacter conchicola]RFZ92110.1 AhpC/TSA family protein [Mucilaginibacter conchicola]